jgi:hypothetical protein
MAIRRNLAMSSGAYRERHWRNIELPPDVLAVPSMLSVDERRLLFSLARDSFSGAGAIVDAGCFLGGSTLALGSGLLANPSAGRVAIDSYDMFLLDEYMLKHYADAATAGQRKPGESCRDLFDGNISSISSIVRVHHGDIREIGWDGRPIEILFLDILKAPNTNDRVVREFFPALIPGRSVLVQQDYIHEGHFWIHITMELLSEYFNYTEFVEYSSAVYLLRKPIPQHVIDGCMWDALSTDDKFCLMDGAINRWQGYTKGVLECARAAMRAWFGDRDGALKDLERIRNDYYWSDHVLTRADGHRDASVLADRLQSTFPGYRSCWSRSSVPGGAAATKFDRSRLVDSQNGKMLGPDGPKLAALCSSRRTSAVVGCRI